MKTGPKNSRRVSYTQWKRIICALLCLALMTAAVFCAAASAEKDGRTVRVGWYDSSFNIMDEFCRRTGYAYEYQMKIAAYTGWRYEYVSGSWSDLLQMLINGEIDLMSDVSYTQERAVKMLFPSMPMGTENYYLFVSQQDQEAVLADYSVLNGKKLGVNRDSVQAGFLREWEERHGIQADVAEVSCSGLRISIFPVALSTCMKRPLELLPASALTSVLVSVLSGVVSSYSVSSYSASSPQPVRPVMLTSKTAINR
jgi:hypothetical protein